MSCWRQALLRSCAGANTILNSTCGSLNMLKLIQEFSAMARITLLDKTGHFPKYAFLLRVSVSCFTKEAWAVYLYKYYIPSNHHHNSTSSRRFYWLFIKKNRYTIPVYKKHLKEVCVSWYFHTRHHSQDRWPVLGKSRIILSPWS